MLKACMNKLSNQVDASCVILTPPDLSLVLTVTRRDSELLCFPGGSREPKEGGLGTAVRELREETGITVLPCHLDLCYQAIDEDDHLTAAYVHFCTDSLIRSAVRRERGIDIVPTDWNNFIFRSAFPGYSAAAFRILRHLRTGKLPRPLVRS